MMSTLTLLTTLLAGPAQADGLSLTGAHLTHGVFGPPRKEAKLLPGDSLVVSFDIAGITADDEGKVRYSIGTELSDSTGKVLFRQAPREQETTASLGGGRLPAFSQVDVGLDQPPGEYKLKVTVSDKAADKSASLTQSFTVLPRAFGLIRLSGSRDPDGQLPAFLPTAGQTVWLHLAVVGFERNNEGQPDVLFEVRVKDDKGKPTVVRPATATINKDVPKRDLALPLQFPLMLNRAGRFTVELKATDRVSGKTVEYSAPVVVRDNH